MRSHCRCIPEAAPECFQQGCSSRRHQLHLETRGISGHAFQKFGGRRSGHRKPAMGTLHKSTADVDCGTGPLVDLQRTNPYCTTNNVGNRIHRSHFVEANFFYRDIMNLRFHSRQELKGSQCQALRVFRERSLFYQRTDAGPISSMLMTVSMLMTMSMLFMRVFMI